MTENLLLDSRPKIEIFLNQIDSKMSSLCRDVIEIIQSYLDVYDYVNSRSVNSSFCGEMDQGRIYPYGTEEIPTWVKKIRLGDNFHSFRDKDFSQLTYVDFGNDKWIDDNFLEKFINLEELHIGNCVVQSWMSSKNTKLTKLYVHPRAKISGSCLDELPQLTHLKFSWGSAGFDDIKGLVNLEWLDFRDCSISGSVLDKFHKLKYLDATNNQNVETNHIFHLPLEFLALSLYAQEKDVDSVHKSHIPTLKILQVKKPGDVFITGHPTMKVIVV